MHTAVRPTLVALAALLAALHVTTAAQSPAKPSEVERQFAKGGRIHMDLSAGDYTLRGTAVDAIRVRWETRDPRDMDRVRADVTVTGSRADVVTRGPKNNFKVTVDLPLRADLDIDLSAGDLKVRGIEGSKLLSMWAGDVSMEVGDAALYQRVDATVSAGEIHAPPFGRSTGGLFRSLHWKGTGKYKLHVRLTAGDLKLTR
jgi:hypothetical protein